VAAPVFHKNVPPAMFGVAVNVPLLPEQIVTLLTLTVGVALAVTVTVPVMVQPEASVTET
jgi:hypothetical protein